MFELHAAAAAGPNRSGHVTPTGGPRIPRAVAWSALAVLALCVSAGCGDSDDEADPGPPTPPRPAPAVTVEPSAIGPRDSVRVTFPARYKVGDTTEAGGTVATFDGYLVRFEQPAARVGGYPRTPCVAGEVAFERAPLQRTKTLTVRVKPPPLASGGDRWCFGRQVGSVIFRRPQGEFPRYPAEKVGEFSFTVEAPDR